MRLSFNDLTIDVHFSPSANNLTKDEIVDTAVALASGVTKPGELLVDIGMSSYVIVRGETGQAHVDVTLTSGDLTFALNEQMAELDFDFDF